MQLIFEKLTMKKKSVEDREQEILTCKEEEQNAQKYKDKYFCYYQINKYHKNLILFRTLSFRLEAI